MSFFVRMKLIPSDKFLLLVAVVFAIVLIQPSSSLAIGTRDQVGKSDVLNSQNLMNLFKPLVSPDENGKLSVYVDKVLDDLSMRSSTAPMSPQFWRELRRGIKESEDEWDEGDDKIIQLTHNYKNTKNPNFQSNSHLISNRNQNISIESPQNKNESITASSISSPKIKNEAKLEIDTENEKGREKQDRGVMSTYSEVKKKIDNILKQFKNRKTEENPKDEKKHNWQSVWNTKRPNSQSNSHLSSDKNQHTSTENTQNKDCTGNEQGTKGQENDISSSYSKVEMKIDNILKEFKNKRIEETEQTEETEENKEHSKKQSSESLWNSFNEKKNELEFDYLLENPKSPLEVEFPFYFSKATTMPIPSVASLVGAAAIGFLAVGAVMLSPVIPNFISRMDEGTSWLDSLAFWKKDENDFNYNPGEDYYTSNRETPSPFYSVSEEDIDDIIQNYYNDDSDSYDYYSKPTDHDNYDNQVNYNQNYYRPLYPPASYSTHRTNAPSPYGVFQGPYRTKKIHPVSAIPLARPSQHQWYERNGHNEEFHRDSKYVAPVEDGFESDSYLTFNEVNKIADESLSLVLPKTPQRPMEETYGQRFAKPTPISGPRPISSNNQSYRRLNQKPKINVPSHKWPNPHSYLNRVGNSQTSRNQQTFQGQGISNSYIKNHRLDTEERTLPSFKPSQKVEAVKLAPLRQGQHSDNQSLDKMREEYKKKYVSKSRNENQQRSSESKNTDPGSYRNQRRYSYLS